MRCNRCAALAAVVGLASIAFGDELYRQDFSGTPSFSSQDARNTGGLGWFSEAADNFPGQADWTITDLVWYGSYNTPLGQEGNTEGFTIRIYDDAGGAPGARIYEQDIFGIGTNIIETPLGIWTSNFERYQYEAALPVAFDVPADGQYWLSIVAILPRGGGATEPQWFTGNAAGVTSPPAYQWFFDPGNFTQQSTDIAVIINGTIGDDTCPADLTGSSDPNDPSYGTPDGVADGEDFFFYLDLFS
ncbi:MAG: GC-type dockerin domain-anchored protein [Phycisphaerales bacterium JB037]